MGSIYLDNTNFVKEASYTSCYKFNKFKEKWIAVKTPIYLRFKIFINKESFIVRVFELSTVDKTFVISDSIKAVFNEHKNVKCVYTKLCLNQTFHQVRRNKYFKTFGKAKQIIETEY